MTRAVPLPRPPIVLERALADPAVVERLLVTHAPYWPVQKYFANDAEYAALSGKTPVAGMIVAPVFRGNWAVGDDVRDGVAPLLAEPAFADAARRLFDAEIVLPTTVYVNCTCQLPFPQGAGHTDIPAFRGLDRSRYPVTFLTIMGLSGLFEDVRLKIATAVAWFYRGADGGFEYWPDGPDAPSRRHEGAIHNTAIVGDNDFMWHRVRPTGRVEDGMPSLSLDAALGADGDAWTISDDGRIVASLPRDRVRVSLSWKALVLASDAERRRWAEHTDDVDLAEVLRRFSADLAARGVALPASDDPVRDPAVIDCLRTHDVRYPTTTAASA